MNKLNDTANSILMIYSRFLINWPYYFMKKNNLQFNKKSSIYNIIQINTSLLLTDIFPGAIRIGKLLKFYLKHRHF